MQQGNSEVVRGEGYNGESALLTIMFEFTPSLSAMGM
jgi:hypothetical protein